MGRKHAEDLATINKKLEIMEARNYREQKDLMETWSKYNEMLERHKAKE
jgi:hypothetical protein